jgi:hypothetical protein
VAASSSAMIWLYPALVHPDWNHYAEA